MSLKRKETRRRGRKRDSYTKGLGADAEITVKGKRADAEQRRVIDEALAEADRLGASRRVMIACVMCMTQESTCRRLRHGDAAGPDSRGPYQQRAAWGPEADRLDPAKSTRMFLTGGKGGQPGWKQKHGSLKHAPGDLNAAIKAVQVSVGGYGQWEKEATKTVDAWRGSDGFGGERTRRKRYEFTRGERGGKRETSWDAMGRLAEEVNFRRWAAVNVLHYASEEELRAQAPSVEINGDEAWLLGEPEWEWGSQRPISELTIRVLADRWRVLPGGVVLISKPGPTQGRWLVKSVSGERLDSPEASVVLTRPTAKKKEPAPEMITVSSGGGASRLLEVCREIHKERRPYRYGGGHGKPLSTIGPKEALDCSSAVSLALKRADMFPGSVAMTSGQLKTWGRAGKGRDFTVFTNDSHVFIQFSDGQRFDTARYGGGEPGPRLRKGRRNDEARFVARHWPSA